MANLRMEDLRRYAVARSLATPSTLPRALQRLGFVQADPIRSPARAQDLILRHRVRDYRAGDLERRYPRLDVEEDFYINYGFIHRDVHALMLPRSGYRAWPQERWDRAHEVLAYVRQHGPVHPQQVDEALSHGNALNWFGGNTRASTQLLDGLHYRGLLRVVRRDSGVRVYAARGDVKPVDDPDAAFDALVDVIVAQYAPVPSPTLGELVGRCLYAAPQWAHLRQAALKRARARLACVKLGDTTWYWPAGENPASRRHGVAQEVRLLAPFDPIVWDRRRFGRFWGWDYRFEAYTPAPKRVRGYYAMPLLWGDEVIGWGNLGVREGCLVAQIGHVGGVAPKDKAFAASLDRELAAMATFLGVEEFTVA